MTKRILLIDNYDSFTYNLLHYVMEVGAEVDVVRNDAMSAAEALAHTSDGILLSPGPCDPDQAGICLDVITQNQGKKPILGVCLGHQSITQAYGGKVVRGAEPVHGKVHAVKHHNHALFAGVPSPFMATRYHSLIAERNALPDCLEVTAETEDGVIMALSHKTHPVHGLQFHPESIASEHGHVMLRNFVGLL